MASMVNAIQFLPTPPDRNLLYIGSYDPVWVVISILLAILASYAALKAAARIDPRHDTTTKLLWTLIAAFTLGIGVWAMHFIGMTALSLPCSARYDP
ncbi:MAG: MHYT domain-containing protein, partial [Gallionella sp.]